MNIQSKGLNKSLKIEITVPDLEERNGDKYATFLEEVQIQLQERYIVQYGSNYRSLVFYDRDSPAAIFQHILCARFHKWAKSKDKTHFKTRFLVPKAYLWQRKVRKALHITCKNVEPIVQVNTLSHLEEKYKWNPMYLIRWDNDCYNIYKISTWEVVGVIHNSQEK